MLWILTAIINKTINKKTRTFHHDHSTLYDQESPERWNVHRLRKHSDGLKKDVSELYHYKVIVMPIRGIIQSKATLNQWLFFTLYNLL